MDVPLNIIMVNSNTSSAKSIESNGDNDTITSSVSKVTNMGIDAIHSFKEKTKSAIRDVSHPRRSQFHNWSDSSMRQLLVDHGIEIRGAAYAKHGTLVRICDDVFGQDAQLDNEAQNMEKKFTIEDVVRIDRAARVIQKSFIASRKRMYAKKFQEYNKRAFGFESRHEHNNINDANVIGYDEHSAQREDQINEEDVLQDQTLECDNLNSDRMQVKTTFPSPSAPIDEERCNRKDERTILFEEDEVFHTPSSRTSKGGNVFGSPKTPKRKSTLKRVRVESADTELEAEWVKPSWKYAKKYEALSRPHRAGTKMKPYLMKDSLGRQVMCTLKTFSSLFTMIPWHAHFH